MNEPARFHAIATTLAQEDAAAVSAIVDALEQEESFRIKNKTAEGLVTRAWPIPADKRDAARKALPSGYTVDAEGCVKKR